MRVLIDRTFGTHIHVFYDGAELVIGLNPLRVIQGEAPAWVRDWSLEWVRTHQQELLLPQSAGNAAIARLARPIGLTGQGLSLHSRSDEI